VFAGKVFRHNSQHVRRRHDLNTMPMLVDEDEERSREA